MPYSDDLAKLVIRLTLGILLIFHGFFKLQHGVSGIEGMLVNHSLPAFLAYGAYVGEILAPIMIIAGFYSRLGGLLAVIHMCFAFFLAHMGQLHQFNNLGGWALELDAFYLFAALAVTLSSPGRYAINGQ